MTKQSAIDAEARYESTETSTRTRASLRRGSQYASHEYQELLRKHGFISNMVGNCWDNACAILFHTLKTELVYLHRYRTKPKQSTRYLNTSKSTTIDTGYIRH